MVRGIEWFACLRDRGIDTTLQWGPRWFAG